MMRAAASIHTLLDTRTEPRYHNDFVLEAGVLLVPNWEPSTLTAYRVVPR